MMKTISCCILLYICFPLLLSAQWSTLALSEAKFYTQAAAAEGKALFIGGAKPGFVPSKKVEIYDFVTPGWTTRTMQNGRVLAGVVVADSLVFIAGGLNPQTGVFLKQVEIYDVKNDVWKPSQNLSVARASAAAVRVGEELWFAGGYIQTSPTALTFYDIIDIYNLQTNTWTTRQLSVPRICSGALLDNKVAFAGGQVATGPVSTVDIFDLGMQQWTTAELSVPRFNMAITTAGPYFLVAGGSTYTEDALDIVDIWNTENNTWTTHTLAQPRASIGAATVCGTTAIFAGGGEADWTTNFLTTSSNQVDIFDATNGEWSQDTLAHARTVAFAASDGEHFFMGGGWYPENSEFLQSVEVYNCTASGLKEVNNTFDFKLFPNPGQDDVWLDFGEEIPSRIVIFDLLGQQIESVNPVNQRIHLSLSRLLPGHYVVRAISRDGKSGWKQWVKW